jgi:ribosomal protein L12E/L44/L45/RPP1/RPP2
MTTVYHLFFPSLRAKISTLCAQYSAVNSLELMLTVRQLISEGAGKLASVPSGGSGGGAAPAAAGGAAAGGAAAEEEKKEEKEEGMFPEPQAKLCDTDLPLTVLLHREGRVR